MRRSTLVYDDGCGPCTRFMRIVAFLDTHHRLDFASLIDADTDGHLNPVHEARRHRSFHLVSPDRTVLSGASAIPKLVSLLPAGKGISAIMVSAPLGQRSISFVYSVLSRLHDSGSCSYESRPVGKSSLKSVGMITGVALGSLGGVVHLPSV